MSQSPEKVNSREILPPPDPNFENTEVTAQLVRLDHQQVEAHAKHKYESDTKPIYLEHLVQRNCPNRSADLDKKSQPKSVPKQDINDTPLK